MVGFALALRNGVGLTDPCGSLPGGTLSKMKCWRGRVATPNSLDSYGGGGLSGPSDSGAGHVKWPGKAGLGTGVAGGS